MQETVEEYNAGVAAGTDPLGKPLGRDVQPLAQPPFYATRLWPKVHHCMGGVAIDGRAQARPPPLLGTVGHSLPPRTYYTVSGSGSTSSTAAAVHMQYYH